MKKKLETIDSTMFRSLNKSEELAMVGGSSTTGPTLILTGPDLSNPDRIIDFKVDPPS
jgi:hypothetical protein